MKELNDFETLLVSGGDRSEMCTPENYWMFTDFNSTPTTSTPEAGGSGFVITPDLQPVP